jgi:hypothetical protein
MVWIEVQECANEIINEEMIQSIYLEYPDPEDLNTDFIFYARINDKKWVIYSAYIPDDIKNYDSDIDIRESYISELGDELYKKLMFFISEAKKKNNCQILSLSEKFLKSGFLDKYRGFS